MGPLWLDMCEYTRVSETCRGRVSRRLAGDCGGRVSRARSAGADLRDGAAGSRDQAGDKGGDRGALRGEALGVAVGVWDLRISWAETQNAGSVDQSAGEARLS